MVCLFCEAKFKQPSNIRSLGDYELTIGKPKLYCEQAKKTFPNHHERVVKIPEAEFHDSFAQSSSCQDPDLIADESLQAHRMTIRNRQTAEDEDKIAKRFFYWATNSNTQPSLILSSFAFSRYLQTQGNKEIFEHLRANDLLGETDVIVLTKNRGTFIVEVKSTFETNARLLADVKKGWEQTQKSTFVFKALNSDAKSLAQVLFHKMVAFPNLSKQTLSTNLCKNHQKICIYKEDLSSQENFDSFIEGILDSKGLGNDFLGESLCKQDYKLVASRYAMISKAKKSPVEQSEISKKTNMKIEKAGTMVLTKEQKDILDKFSYEKKQGTKLLLNGHYGSGKTIILQHGFRKLFRTIESSREKHVIIFSSLAFVKGSQGLIHNPDSKAYNDKFLRDVKDSLHQFIDKKENVKVVVGHFIDDVMAEFGISSRCPECEAKQSNKCNHDIKKMFRVNDIARVANAASKQYLKSRSRKNVHFFLDEVRSFDQDWSVLSTDSLMQSNVIWLALRPEHFNENEVKFDVANFTIRALRHNLRNSRAICDLTNEIRRYILSFWPICKFSTSWTKNMKYIKKDIPNTVQTKFAKSSYSLPKHWHHVSGTQPRLIILSSCSCESKVQFTQKCDCFDARIEAALKQSLIQMWDLDEKQCMKDVFDMVPSNVTISLRITSKGKVIDHSLKHILEKDKVPHVIDTADGKEILEFSKEYQDCKIRLIDSDTVLGKEYDNLIYLIDALYAPVRINPVTKDINKDNLLDNCSRARSQIHIITPGGREMNRIRLRYNPEDWWNIYWAENSLNEPGQWSAFGYEVIDAFMLVHLLQNGFLLFLPQPDQQGGKQEAIQLLREGRDLEAKLKKLNRIGEKANRDNKSLAALGFFINGLKILQRRLTGDCPATRFDPLRHLGNNNYVNSYLKKIEYQEFKLLMNCGLTLQKLDTEGNDLDACILFHFLVEFMSQDEDKRSANDKRAKEIQDMSNELNEVLNEVKLEHNDTYDKSKSEFDNWKKRIRDQADGTINRDPDGGWNLDYDNFVYTIFKKAIINELPIPLSGYNEAKLLAYPTGIEPDDI